MPLLNQFNLYLYCINCILYQFAASYGLCCQWHWMKYSDRQLNFSWLHHHIRWTILDLSCASFDYKSFVSHIWHLWTHWSSTVHWGFIGLATLATCTTDSCRAVVNHTVTLKQNCAASNHGVLSVLRWPWNQITTAFRSVCTTEHWHATFFFLTLKHINQTWHTLMLTSPVIQFKVIMCVLLCAIVQWILYLTDRWPLHIKLLLSRAGALTSLSLLWMPVTAQLDRVWNWQQ